MAELTYTIAAEKVAEYVEAYCYVHKNVEIKNDPDWVDPEDGSSVTQIPKYNDTAWVREHILRSIKGQIVRGKGAMARDALASQNADEVT